MNYIRSRNFGNDIQTYSIAKSNIIHRCECIHICKAALEVSVTNMITQIQTHLSLQTCMHCNLESVRNGMRLVS